MRSFLNSKPKWSVFGVAGMLGAALFSVLAEPAARISDSPPPAPGNGETVDLVFVLDVTGSMQNEINGVRSSINELISQSEARGVSMRFALVTFRDLDFDEPTLVVQGFTSDPKAFAEKLTGIRAFGGGENRGESSLDGLRVASGLPFNQAARKVAVLVTDETWHEPDGRVRSCKEVVTGLRSSGLGAIHVVGARRIIDDFSFLTEAAPGRRFVLEEDGRTERALGLLFQRVAQEVVSPSMIGAESRTALKDYSAASYAKGVASVGLWLALVATGIGVCLLLAQRYMLGGELAASSQLMPAVLGILICAASGVAAQSVYFLLSSLGFPETLGRLLTWTLVGSGLGMAIAHVIPNVPRLRSVICGAVGGILASLGFLMIVKAMNISEFGGRMGGALILGFALGIAAALAEMIARQAYLVIHWAKNETSTVNIGRTPVLVGTNSESTIRLSRSSGYPASVATFRMIDGKATLTNHMSRTTHPLSNGNKLTLGTVVIEVRILS